MELTWKTAPLDGDAIILDIFNLFMYLNYNEIFNNNEMKWYFFCSMFDINWSIQTNKWQE